MKPGAPGALAGVRIRIVADAIAGQYAGWLLAGMGADVERLSTAGMPASPLQEWLGAGIAQRRVEVIPPLPRIAADCDALIVDHGEQLDARVATGFLRLTGNRDDLVAVSLSPFGLTGPWTTRIAGPQELQALSGLMHATGDPDHPPSAVAGRIVEMACGANVANAVLLGLIRKARFGAGSCVDVSGLESIVCLQASRILAYAYTGLVYRRNNDANLNNFLPCRDGYLCLTFWVHPFDKVLEFLELPPGSLPRELVELKDIGQQYAHPDVVAAVNKALASRTRAEWIERAKSFRIPATPVLTAAELVRDPHLGARGYFQDLQTAHGVLRVPGHPFRGPVWGSRATRHDGSAAPGQRHRQPLEGLRVTEVGLAWSAPMAAETFAQYGAEVIKLESPTRLDTARSMPLMDLELRTPWWEYTYNYHPVNAGKRHFGFNAAGPSAGEVRERLLRATDVVFTNYSVRALRNLAFDGDAVRRVNPRCSVVHSTGFGWDGPYRDMVAYGTGMEGMTGMALETGGALGPVRSPLLHPDIFASMHQMLAGLAALFRREASGEGCVVDLAQLECGVVAVFEQLAIAQGAPARPDGVPRRVVRCAGDDEWLSVSPRNAGEAERADAILGAPASSSRHQLAEALLGEGIPAAPVLGPDEVLQLEVLRARDYFTRVDGPFGVQLAIGRWHQFRDLPARRLDGVHPFGADTESILRDTLGFSADDVWRFTADGTVGPAPTDSPQPPAGSSPVDWMVRTRQIYRRDTDYREKLGLKPARR